jgi:hypothetical protein
MPAKHPIILNETGRLGMMTAKVMIDASVHFFEREQAVSPETFKPGDIITTLPDSTGARKIGRVYKVDDKLLHYTVSNGCIMVGQSASLETATDWRLATDEEKQAFLEEEKRVLATEAGLEQQRRQLEARAKQENMPVVYMPREQYNKLDWAVIREQEEKYHCIFIPAEEYEIQRMREDAVPYTMPPMPDLSAIEMKNPVMYDTPYIKGGRYQEPPRDLKKKKKARRRAQKQARRKGRR